MPLFALGSEDDLILDPKTIPKEEVQQGDFPIMIATAAKGAHAALITGNIIPKCWY